MDGLTIKSVLHECSLDQGSPSRSGMSSDGEDILDQLEAASTPKTVKAPRKPVSDRTTTTLFIRNLPFTTTSKEFESFFSEFGPLKACFVVTDAAVKGQEVEASEEQQVGQKSKGFGFVHYALEEDAQKALESLKATKFQGRKLKGELAMRKHVKFDAAIMKAELPKAHQQSAAASVLAGKAERPKKLSNRLSNRVEIAFTAEEGKALAEFNKKQLYKKVRKVAEFVDLEYPAEGDAGKAVVTFASSKEASKGARKLDKHIFKGAKMAAKVLMAEAGAVTSTVAVPKIGAAGNGIKAHRLIVRNLPFAIDPSVLDTHFSSFGKVLEIVLPTKPGSKQLRGFAFVQYDQRESAVMAMAASNGKEIAGRTVAVDWAVGKTLYEQIVKSEEAAPADDEITEDIADVEESAASDKKEKQKEKKKEKMEEEVKTKIVVGNDEERTVFVRNISFETSEESIAEKFSTRFGPIDYAKLVVNPQTGASRGTAFIRFQSVESAQAAIHASTLLSQEDVLASSQFNIDAVTTNTAESLEELKRKRAGKAFKSVLVDNDATVEDAEKGGILLEGRALSVVSAVKREDAAKLRLIATQSEANETDKRRLRLLHESLPKPATPAAKKFWSPEEIKARQVMIKARLADLRKNPNTVVSNVRLSIRHLPVAVDEAQLRSVMEHLLSESRKHAKDVLADNPIHQDNAMRAHPRLKQVKVVRSTGEERENRAGRSKGFAFVELTQPSHTLLALRYATNYIPDIWHHQLPEIFGRRSKESTTTNAPKGKTGKAPAKASAKPMIPVIEFAIDKVVVLEKKGQAPVERKEQVHRKHLKRPTGPAAAAGKKRPGFNQPSSKAKRSKTSSSSRK